MRGAWAFGLLVFYGLFGPAQAETQTVSTRLIEIIGEKATEDQTSPEAGPAISVARLKPCGTKETLRLCGTLTAAAPTFKTPGVAVSAPQGAEVIVSWTGSLFCQSRFRPVAVDTSYALFREYLVSFQIGDGKLVAPEVNGDGAGSVGRRDVRPHSDAAAAADAIAPGYELYPVAVTRTLRKTRDGTEKYGLALQAEFREGLSAFCNVNGGAMTAIVVK